MYADRDQDSKGLGLGLGLSGLGLVLVLDSLVLITSLIISVVMVRFRYYKETKSFWFHLQPPCNDQGVKRTHELIPYNDRFLSNSIHPDRLSSGRTASENCV